MTAEGTRPVVAGIDGSQEALAAARFAAGEAARRNAPLHLLLAFPWTERRRVPAPESFDVRAALRTAAELALEAVAESVARDAPGVPTVPRLVEGRAVDVLLAAGETAQLLVVGSQSTGSVGDLLLGSTAAAVARATPCPVIVVPQRTGTMVTSRSGVVVGLDGDPGDDELLTFALRTAADRQAPLIAVHTWLHTVPGFAHLALEPLVDEATAQRREEAVLTDALDRLGPIDVPVQLVVQRGSAAAALLSAALTAELVVVGHRRRRGGAVGNLRSTANAVLHRSPCPVAVVPLSTP